MSDFFAGEPHHEVLELVNIIDHVCAPECGDHLADVPAAKIACFFDGHIPNLVCEFVEYLHGVRSVGDAGITAIGSVPRDVLRIVPQIGLEPGPKSLCSYNHLSFPSLSRAAVIGGLDAEAKATG
jgi:hypothetical protein